MQNLGYFAVYLWSHLVHHELVREEAELLPEAVRVVVHHVGHEEPDHLIVADHGVRGDDGEPAHKGVLPLADEVAGHGDHVGHQLGRGQARHESVVELWNQGV